MHPELRHLRYFVAVADELNFTSAARRLYVSQQALSRVIQQLERELGVRLFERTTRSVRLTAAGQAMLASARLSTTAAAAAAEAARQAAAGDTARVLRVDISSAGLETGALILQRLRRDHPDIAVHQVEEGVPRGLTRLAHGELDVLLGLASDLPAGAVCEPLRNEPVLVGMAADHPLARCDVVPVSQLGGVELLLPSEEAAPEWNRFVAGFCGQAGVAPRRWTGITHGSVAAAEVLREERCVVPTNAWRYPPQDLVFRPLVDPVPVFPWSMMTTRAGASRPELQAFVRCARELSAERRWLAEAGASRTEEQRAYASA